MFAIPTAATIIAPYFASVQNHRNYMSIETHRITPSEVLQVKELREEIFKFLDKGTLACCARICSAWSNSALSLIWVELESLKPLLELLGCLAEGQVRSLIILYRFRI